MVYFSFFHAYALFDASIHDTNHKGKEKFTWLNEIDGLHREFVGLPSQTCQAAFDA